MRFFFFCLLTLVCLTGSGAEFFLTGPREELNLIQEGAWQEAIGDSMDLTRIPEKLVWSKTEFPTKNLFRKLNSADPKWASSTLPPEQYFQADGSLRVQTKRPGSGRSFVQIRGSYQRQERGGVAALYPSSGIQRDRFAEAREK